MTLIKFGTCTESMQQRLGIAVWLLAPLENQGTGGAKRQAFILPPRHWLIVGITCILCANLCRHPRQGGVHFHRGADAMGKPIGQKLGGNSQCRPIFHQSDIVNIRYLRAPHALIDPAHDISQDASRVIVPFFPDLGIAPVADRQWEGQKRVQ